MDPFHIISIIISICCYPTLYTCFLKFSFPLTECKAKRECKQRSGYCSKAPCPSGETSAPLSCSSGKCSYCCIGTPPNPITPEPTPTCRISRCLAASNPYGNSKLGVCLDNIGDCDVVGGVVALGYCPKATQVCCIRGEYIHTSVSFTCLSTTTS